MEPARFTLGDRLRTRLRASLPSPPPPKPRLGASLNYPPFCIFFMWLSG